MPLVDHTLLYVGSVDYVAVVSNRHSAESAVKHDRLGVDDVAGPHGGIPDVAYRHVGGRQKTQFLFVKNRIHESHVLVVSYLVFVVAYRNPRTFLPPVLKGEKSVINVSGKFLFLFGNYSEYPALFVRTELSFV